MDGLCVYVPPSPTFRQSFAAHALGGSEDRPCHTYSRSLRTDRPEVDPAHFKGSLLKREPFGRHILAGAVQADVAVAQFHEVFPQLAEDEIGLVAVRAQVA